MGVHQRLQIAFKAKLAYKLATLTELYTVGYHEYTPTIALRTHKSS